MAEKGVFALLVSERIDSLEGLRAMLRGQSVGAWSAQSCEEVAQLLEQTRPDLIFTDVRLCDGTWVDVVSLAEKASAPTNVIVVGACKDARLYISAMDHGAFDFILPPFEVEPMAHVLKVAVDNVRHRRQDLAVQAVV